MLRTNLSTRPFYNDRAVSVALAVAAAIVVALTLFNVSEVLELTARNRETADQVAAAETSAAEFGRQARAIRGTLDTGDVESVRTAAREANDLIERRAFSWTELFNRFEETLPGEVRIAAVQPQLDQDGRMLVSVTTIARRVEDLDAFLDKLEETGAFRGILSRQEEVQEDGTLRSVIQGYYGEPATTAAGPAGSSSEPADAGPGNQSPRAAAGAQP